MEEDQELKHSCKLCSRSFPCGRSLGGHMRSHVINSQETHHKKKLSSLTSNGGNNAFLADAGYGLRENPRKTCRFEDLSEDSLLLCKECGKGFQSWKALFGHMKCHSERVEEEDDDDSWTLVMEDSQSDNEIGVPNRGKRSSRRIKRYIATINANGSPSVCEIEQEQEEVAMCLMMLSRDVGHWGGGLNSVGESSYNNFDFLEAPLSSKIEGGNKNSIFNPGEVVKFKKLRNGKLEATVLDPEKCKSGERKSEFGASGIPRNGSKMNKSDIQLGKNLVTESEFYLAKLGSRKSNSSKRKGHDLFDPELDYGASDSQEMYREKKSKFECTTCNKTFHSYQALGGHRASHKKLKGCSSWKIDGGENSLETDQISANPTDHETSYGSKKNKGGSHECPICFRVFSSGQALGGHKRSHLIGGCSEAKSNQISSRIETQRPIQETARDFLDLNKPAPVEEEGSNSHGGGFKTWWVGSNHKHEPTVGLLTN